MMASKTRPVKPSFLACDALPRGQSSCSERGYLRKFSRRDMLGTSPGSALRILERYMAVGAAEGRVAEWEQIYPKKW